MFSDLENSFIQSDLGNHKVKGIIKQQVTMKCTRNNLNTQNIVEMLPHW